MTSPLPQTTFNNPKDFLQVTYNNISSDAEVSTLKAHSDAELWDLFRAGNEMAFIQIYRNYVNILFTYGKRYCADRELIKDCIQDFFLYLREKRTRLGQTTSIKFYLLRSYRRRLFTYLNKQGNESLDNSFFEVAVEECNTQKFINNEAKSFTIDRLNTALDRIKPKQREAIYLYYYQKLSYKEIAHVMQFTHVSSARRLVYDALSRLKSVMEKSS